ncbi:MAG: hypothetical protein JWN01_29 [Patescibacteria group bacterium]|nr:hypothetical protein [Patescibacteria group bacterium]
MKIGLDFGGVITDVRAVRLRLMKQMLGVRESAHVLELSLDPRLSLDEYQKLQHLVYGTSEFLNVSAVPNALRSLKQLKQQGHTVWLVSNMQVTGVQFAKQWLTDHEIDSTSFVSVGVGGDKKMVLQHEFDLYVDARSEVLASLVGTIPHLFLFDTVYNRDDRVEVPIVRAEGWGELMKRIEYAASLNAASATG